MSCDIPSDLDSLHEKKKLVGRPSKVGEIREPARKFDTKVVSSDQRILSFQTGLMHVKNVDHEVPKQKLKGRTPGKIGTKTWNSGSKTAYLALKSPDEKRKPDPDLNGQLVFQVGNVGNSAKKKKPEEHQEIPNQVILKETDMQTLSLRGVSWFSNLCSILSIMNAVLGFEFERLPRDVQFSSRKSPILMLQTPWSEILCICLKMTEQSEKSDQRYLKKCLTTICKGNTYLKGKFGSFMALSDCFISLLGQPSDFDVVFSAQICCHSGAMNLKVSGPPMALSPNGLGSYSILIDGKSPELSYHESALLGVLLIGTRFVQFSQGKCLSQDWLRVNDINQLEKLPCCPEGEKLGFNYVCHKFTIEKLPTALALWDIRHGEEFNLDILNFDQSILMFGTSYSLKSLIFGNDTHFITLSNIHHIWYIADTYEDDNFLLFDEKQQDLMKSGKYCRKMCLYTMDNPLSSFKTLVFNNVSMDPNKNVIDLETE